MKALTFFTATLAFLSGSAFAVTFISTDNVTTNTSAPTGVYADTGWQYQGNWGTVSGTAISSEYFITAKHVGGSVGDVFSYNGTNYTTTARFLDPASDLAIWKVATPFTSWASLYDGSDEVSKNLVVFGRGTERGAEVNISAAREKHLRGWRWGAETHVQRWGTNLVSGTVNAGKLLQATFSRVGGTEHEAHLSVGDSGGGVFIQEGGVWKLAGVNFSVDGNFSLTGTNGSGFSATIFDAGGLYFGSDGSYSLIPDGAGDVQSSFYASRISANRTFINSVVSPEPIPEPGSFLFVAGGLIVGGAWLIRKKNARLCSQGPCAATSRC